MRWALIDRKTTDCIVYAKTNGRPYWIESATAVCVSRDPEKLIPLHGGYRKLKSFQVAQLAYDVTVRFCDRYIEKRSRTHVALLSGELRVSGSTKSSPSSPATTGASGASRA